MRIELEVARYYLTHRSTVRECAIIFGKSKSTIHNFLHTKLKTLNPELYKKVSVLARLNFNEKHIRGGNATKLKHQCSLTGLNAAHHIMVKRTVTPTKERIT